VATLVRDPRLALPPRPPRHVLRPRLLAALDAAETSPVTLVSAGPGTGKSTLLSEWARCRNGNVGWLSLTATDDDRRRFWPLFLQAVRATGAAGDDLPLGRPGGSTELLDTIYPHVPEAGAPAVLVLDDAHVLRDPDILAGLDSIIRLWQPRLRLVLASRSDPLLPLPRYRMNGDLSELRASQLAMTAQEARELLAAHHVELADTAFTALLHRTEGWTAGLRLSALRLEGVAEPERFVAEFALDEGSVGEYLLSEVLAQQPPAARRLLIETSFLSEITGPLAQRITGIPAAADLLDQLARKNSFVVPIDRERTRFRYHHLLSEVLRYLLQRRSPERTRTLYRRAGGWFREQGEIAAALHWYARAGDATAATTMLVRGGFALAHVRGQSLLDTGDGQLTRRDFDNAGPAERKVLEFLLPLRAPDPRGAPEQLARWRDSLAEDDLDLLVAARLAELRLARRVGDWPAMDAAASQLLVDQPEAVSATPGLRASALLARAAAAFWSGEPPAAVSTLLADALKSARTESAHQVEVDILGLLAYAEVRAARPRHACISADAARALLAAEPALRAPDMLDLALAATAFLAADFDSMASALRRLGACRSGDPDAAMDGAVALAEAAMLAKCGQTAEAHARLEACEALSTATTGLLAVRRELLFADIETSLGRPNSALALLEPYLSTALADLVGVRRSWAYLALGDLSAAESCARTVLTSTRSDVGRLGLVEGLLCEAEINHRGGHESRCVELLVRAIEIADGDIVLPFANVADVFADVLARHSTVAARWPLPPRTDPPVIHLDIRIPAQLAHPLTERERAVLRYLATSMSTAEIAAELYLSVNTIKTHLAAIYRKLAAKRRRDAVLRARELELL
jgi:LuxR family maltose regulon positive regulatory protein